VKRQRTPSQGPASTGPENEGTTASSGNCAVTGTVTLNSPNDHIISCAQFGVVVAGFVMSV
jgi:hypothetical protein